MEDEELEDDEETGIQSKNSRTAHLKPWQFKKGQSGNPSGKPAGTISLKVFARNYIQNLTDEEKIDFLEGIDKKTVWEMSEGKAESKTDITSNGESINPVLVKFIDGTKGT